MKNSKPIQLLYLIGLISLITLFSCRKKDERYEGIYVGTERQTNLDSGATVYSLDSTYIQEIEVTYHKKIFTFLISNYNDVYGTNVFTVDKNSIVDHEYQDGGAFLKFSGDSMYLNIGSLDTNWNQKNLNFKGKRN